MTTVRRNFALHALIEASIRGLQCADEIAVQVEGWNGNALGLDMQLVADPTYFVTEVLEADYPIACGGWSLRRTLFDSDGASVRESERLDPTSDATKIRAIFVHPGFARQGSGTLLLAHAEDRTAAAGFSAFEMGRGSPEFRSITCAATCRSSASPSRSPMARPFPLSE